MIEMVNTVNKTTFAGANRVTCFTCHNGRPSPVAAPNVVGEQLPPALGETISRISRRRSAERRVTATQVLDKYLAAAGGTGAMQKTPSLVANGTMTSAASVVLFPAQRLRSPRRLHGWSSS